MVAVLLSWPFLSWAAEHPSLLLNREGVAQLKQKIAQVDFAKKGFEQMRKAMDKAIESPIELPPRGQNWYHWYVCPKHGNRLTTGKQIGKWEWEHVCPVDKEVFKGDPSGVKTDFDGCALSSVHGGHARQIRDCGIVYQVTGEAKYAQRAKELLIAYAEQYEKYPLHTTQNQPKIGGGKIGCQTLDESVWMIPAAQGADLVWETLSASERETISNKLFKVAAKDVILPHKIGVHNIQCWKNSAVGLIGFLLEDQSLVKAAIDDPQRGFRMQMEKGVSESGQWWEGAWGYHFYTVSACWPLVEAARNHGIDLWQSRYRKLFDGPLMLAMPNRLLPNFNDSGYVNLASQGDLYELAYARYQDAKFAGVLKAGRTGDLALLFGVSDLSAAVRAEPRPPNANFPDIGYGILRRGTGAAPDKDTWVCLKYGPHGGGHGHPDKLSFVLYSQGKVVAPDGGITSYGSPMHMGWYKATLAHSTLVIDEANQKEAEGKCLAFGSAGGVDYVCAEAGAIAPGVRFVRTLALLDAQRLLVIDQVSASKEHTFDLAYHHRGTIEGSEGSAWTGPAKPGYQYLKDGRIRALSDGPVLIKGENGMAAISSAADANVQLITATGPGASSADRVPVVIWRGTGKELCLAWCVSLDGKGVKLELMKGKGVSVRVDGKTIEVDLVGKDVVRVK